MSVGYRELFHRIFDFLDFYKVRRMFSVELNGVRIPSVLKLSSLNLDRNSDVTFADYSFTWDWEDFGKTLGTEEDKGVGVTAPFSISSHGYYETDNGECYFLYIMNNKGELSVDFDIITGDEQFSFVFAKSGVGKFTTDGGLLLLTDTDVMNSAFSSSYISFSNTTVVSPTNTENFYTGGYSESTEAQNNPLYDILPTVNGNTSVARFHEECMNRNVKKSNVLYQFNNGESGSSHHMAVNYGDVRSQGSLDNDSFPKNAVIFQDGLLISPGDVWYSDFQYYYEFKLHIGKVNITEGTPDNHIPGDWGSDKFVKFTLNFVRNDVSESVPMIKLSYDGFGTSTYTDYLKTYFERVFESFGFDIFAEEVVGSSYTSYDVVFRSDRYFDVLFSPDMKNDLTEDTPYISRYTSYYNFKGLVDFVFVPHNVGLFKLVFNYTTANPITIGYTPSRDMEVSDRIDLDMPTLTNVPPVLTYGVVNRQNVHDLTFYSTMLSANDDNFPTLQVYCNAYINYVSTINTPANVPTAATIKSFDLSDSSTCPTLNPLSESIVHVQSTDTLKSFQSLMVPWKSNVTGGAYSPTPYWVYFTMPTQNSPIDDIVEFLQEKRVASNGDILMDDDFASEFYKNFVTSSYMDNNNMPVSYGFPLNSQSSNPWVFRDTIHYPYQFFSDTDDLTSVVYPNTDFQGYYFYPPHYNLSTIRYVQDSDTSVPLDSKYLWVTLPTYYDWNNSITTRVLVGDYGNIQSTSAFNLVLIDEIVESGRTYKYYYISTDSTFTNTSYQDSFVDYNASEIAQLSYTGASHEYFPNFVAKDFYEYALSMEYLLSTSNEQFFSYIDTTMSLALSKIAPPSHFKCFAFGQSKDIFSVYVLNSTYLHLHPNHEFAIVAKSVDFLDESLIPVSDGSGTTTRPLILGNSYTLARETLQSRCVGSLYKVRTIGEGSSGVGTSQFDFRYASLRYNDRKNTGSFEPARRNQDIRRFFYPIKVTFIDNSERIFIIRIKCVAEFADGIHTNQYLSPFMDCICAKSYAKDNGSVNVVGVTRYSHPTTKLGGNVSQSTFGMSIGTNDVLFSGIRPLVFPSASRSSDDYMSVYTSYPINNFDNVGVAEALCTAIEGGLKDNFTPYLEMMGTDTTNPLLNQINPYTLSGVDVSLIPVKSSSTITFTSYAGSTITPNSVASQVCEGTVLLNQKVPFAYFYYSDNNTRKTIWKSIQDYFQPQGLTVSSITLGSLTITEETFPIILEESLIDVDNVDLIDVSVRKPQGTAFKDSTIFHIGNNDDFIATLRSSDGFSLKYTDNLTQITKNVRTYSCQSNDYLITFNGNGDDWGLLTTFFRGMTGNEPSYVYTSTNLVDAISVPDYGQTDSNDDTYYPSLNGPMLRGGTYSASTEVAHYFFSWGTSSDFVIVAYQPSLPFAFYSNNTAFNTNPTSSVNYQYFVDNNSSYATVSRLYGLSDSLPVVIQSQALPQGSTGVWMSQTVPQDGYDIADLWFTEETVPSYAFLSSECILASYFGSQGVNCDFVDTISNSVQPTSSNYDSYLYKTEFVSVPVASGAGNLLYESGTFSTNHGDLYTSLSNLSIGRQHYQEWSPYIGADAHIPQGDSSDDTTQFILYSSSSDSGRVLSFNGNEAYLSLFVKDGDGNYTDVEDTDITHFPDLRSKRLSIDRFHSGYTWDMSKTLDSTVSFKTVYDYETIGSEVVEIPFGYEEGADSILTEEQTMKFYGNFIPMKATYIDASTATPVENGGDASDEPVGTLGGGGADV